MHPNDTAFPIFADGPEGLGLTKREWAATLALQGLLSGDVAEDHDGASLTLAAEVAVRAADALLARLAATRPPREIHTPVQRSCSHCHATNRFTPGTGPAWCAACRHRADVPRLDCTCERCRFGRPPVDA